MNGARPRGVPSLTRDRSCRPAAFLAAAALARLPLMGIDVWAPRLFEPAMLDRLMTWTRRILGEPSAGVAERVAYRNAAALYHAE